MIRYVTDARLRIKLEMYIIDFISGVSEVSRGKYTNIQH